MGKILFSLAILAAVAFVMAAVRASVKKETLFQCEEKLFAISRSIPRLYLSICTIPLRQCFYWSFGAPLSHRMRTGVG